MTKLWKGLALAGVLCAAPLASANDESKGSVHQIDGTISTVERDRLLIQDESGEPMLLQMNEETVVLQGGEPASLEALPEGSEVRVSFDPRGGELQATTIEVLSEGEGETRNYPAPGQPQGYGDSPGGIVPAE